MNRNCDLPIQLYDYIINCTLIHATYKSNFVPCSHTLKIMLANLQINDQHQSETYFNEQ